MPKHSESVLVRMLFGPTGVHFADKMVIQIQWDFRRQGAKEPPAVGKTSLPIARDASITSLALPF